MPNVHGTNVTITKSSSFADIAGWLDQRAPNAGNEFIKWCEAHSKSHAPIDLNSKTYGPPPNNRAWNWLGAWLLLGNLGPELGKLLGLGITGGAKVIPKELQSAGQGIGNTPGLKALGNVGQLVNINWPQFSNLRDLVIRTVKVIAGLTLVAIGAVKLFHVQDAVKEVAPVIAKGAAIV